MEKSFFLESFQLRIFTFTYILSGILVYWLLSFLILELDILFIVFATLVLLIAAIVGWAYLYLLFSIPQRLAGEFDSIKNDISTGRIRTIPVFAKELNFFLVKFYSYSFFDVLYSAVIIENRKYFSSGIIENVMEWDKIDKIITADEKPVYNGKIVIDNSSLHAYSTPICFGKSKLGFFTVFTPGKLGNQRLKLLSDLENYFIDDQLIHVLNKEKHSQL